jgi:hypothetical protein
MAFKVRFLRKIVFVLAAVAVLGGLVMALWNAIVPDLFTGARSIDYLHALGLLVLSRILFGGFRGYGGWHGGHRHWRHRGPWSAMTPEERERFGRGGGCSRGRDEAPTEGLKPPARNSSAP